MEKFLNTEWQFKYGAEKDGQFFDIALPHTFQLPYYGESSFYVGYGVYKKILKIDDVNCVTILAFEGVFQHCEIFLKDIKIAEHFGGYTPFDVEISDFVELGDNEIIIVVDNLWRGDLPPRAGEHTFCGGIYRDVSLISLPHSHIKRNSITIVSQNVDVKNFKADIKVFFSCEKPCGEKLKMFISYDGSELTEHNVIDGDKVFYTFALKNINLWSPETPNIYTLTIVYNGVTYCQTFGIRTAVFDKDKGFFLNGSHYLLEGVNVHQDHGGWGDAVTRAGITRDLVLVKEAGFNFVRGSHYPKHRFFAQECDRLGLLFWCEATFWGIGGFGGDGYWDSSAMPRDKTLVPIFEQRCLKCLDEMIPPLRNNPSVIVWSMGNEMFFTHKDTLGLSRELVKKMLARTKELDPTRAAGVGGTQRGGFHLLGDVTGFNGDGATLYIAPKIPNMVSEYGSVTSSRPGKYALRYTDGTEKNHEWRCGRALWCAFHHGSIADIGNMGIIDLYRLPLNSYYAYRERLRGIPPPSSAVNGNPTKIIITADKMVIDTDGCDDSMLFVGFYDDKNRAIINNSDIVLTIVSGEATFPTGKKWTMSEKNGSLANGSGAIEMRSYKKGEIIVEAVSGNLPPVQIEINAIGEGDFAVTYPQVQSSYRQKKCDVDVLCNRPVSASSEEAIHGCRLANDDNEDTFWSPDKDDKNVFWRIDTEGVRTIKSIKLEMSKCRLKIELSQDGVVWTTIRNDIFCKKYSNYEMKIKSDIACRFIKINIKGKNIKVKSIRAFEK